MAVNFNTKTGEINMIHEDFIAKDRINILKKIVEKVNRKAKKLGCDPISLTITDEEEVIEFKDNHEIDRVIVNVKVILEGQDPAVEGYELISVFQLEGTASQNVVFTHTVPGKELPSKYFNKNSIHCDHCKHNRFRKTSYLLRNVDTNEYIEVGSTCLKDFFQRDISTFLFQAKYTLAGLIEDANDEERWGYSAGYHGYPLERFMAVTAAVVEEYGWVSKSKAYYNDSLTPTVYLVCNQFGAKKKSEIIPVKDHHKELGIKAIEHFKNVDATNNEYLSNCKKIAECNYVFDKTEGIAASMISSFVNCQRKEEEKKFTKESNYVGNIKERLKDIKVKCFYKNFIDTEYGTSTLYMFVDDNGNIFKTFYSGNSWEVDNNEQCILTGTVKKHEEYKDKKSTMLNRCAVKYIEK
jgi:hypothetical protein